MGGPWGIPWGMPFGIPWRIPQASPKDPVSGSGIPLGGLPKGPLWECLGDGMGNFHPPVRYENETKLAAPFQLNRILPFLLSCQTLSTGPYLSRPSRLVGWGSVGGWDSTKR